MLELAQRKFLRQVIQYADAMETSPFPRLFVLDFLSEEEKTSLKAVEQPEGKAADEQVHQCPLAAAEAAESAAAAANIQVILVLQPLTLQCDIGYHATFADPFRLKMNGWCFWRRAVISYFQADLEL